MTGVAKGRRGEGLGEEKGDGAVEDLVRASGPRGSACGGLGDDRVLEPVGVPARCTHGAGDRERTTAEPRRGGGEDVLSTALFHCQRAPSTASSSALPFSDTGALLSSSSN